MKNIILLLVLILASYAYTKEVYSDHSEVIAIGLNLYPHWQKADSQVGINSRGTSTWTKIAKK